MILPSELVGVPAIERSETQIGILCVDTVLDPHLYSPCPWAWEEVR